MPKKGDDFATDVDLALERQIAAALVEATGIEVHGEEFGGAAVDSSWVWVLDPIDGTFNYAAGSPMASILLGLLHDGDPVAGLTWLPFTGDRYTAVAGGPLIKNGAPQPSLRPARLADALGLLRLGPERIGSGNHCAARSDRRSRRHRLLARRPRRRSQLRALRPMLLLRPRPGESLPLL